MSVTLPPPSSSCPLCGAAGAVEGFCPACLLESVLTGPGEPVDPPAEAGKGTGWCGPYRILGEIARGGMGIVYRAEQPGLNREVALKRLAAASAGPEAVRRFRLECEAVARLDHPHIVPVYAVGEHEGEPFFVMKLASGGTLAQHLREHGPWPEREAATLMAAVARAIHFAHGHGVLHRDLKPANILLDSGGQPLVSDFGLARLLHGPGSDTLTGTAIGTPACMSPEQASGKPGAVTTLSDVYSLGAILYHMLTGELPFRGDSPLEVLRQVESVEPVPPGTLRPGLDRDLATVCLKCLAKSPARRYPSADALAEDLERWLHGEPVMARPARWPERVWKWSRRRPVAATAAALTLTGVAVLAGLLGTGHVMLRRERNFALGQEAAARAEAARAMASEQAMRLNVYASDVALARRALEEGNLGVARRTLDGHVPAPGQADLRGYEWHALHRLCQGDDARIFRGHTGSVECVSFSTDGTRLLSAGRGGRAIVRVLPDGRALQEIPRPDAPEGAAEIPLMTALVAQSPEAVALLAGGKVNVSELRMRGRPSRLAEVTAAACSPDGTEFLTGGGGGYARLWNTAAGTLRGLIPVAWISQAAWSPDGRRLVLAIPSPPGQPGGEVRLYDRASLARVRTVPLAAPCFALSADGGRIVVVREGTRLEIQELVSGAVLQEQHFQAGAGALAATADLRLLAVMAPDGGSLALWHPDRQEAPVTLPAGGERFRAVALTKDGRTLATAGSGHAIRFHDPATLTERAVLRGHDDEILTLAFSPDGRQIASGGNDHTVRLWSVPPAGAASGAEPPDLPETGPLVAVSPAGTHLLSGDGKGPVACLTVSGGRAATPGGAARKPLGFARDGSRFLTLRAPAGTAPLLEWWTLDAMPDGPPVPLEAEAGGASAVCEAAGWVAIADGARRGVRLCDWQTGRLLRALPPSPFPQPGTRYVVAPDGSALIAVGWPDYFSLCDLRGPGKWSAQGPLMDGVVGPVVVSPDSTLLASAGDDNAITLRHLPDGAVLTTLRGHMAEVKSLAFSPDGRTLASSSDDLTLRLWHCPTWRELGPLHRGVMFPRLLFAGPGPVLFAEEYRRGFHLLPGAGE